MLLDTIKGPNDIKKLNPKDYQALAQEIRDFIIQSVSETGGHLASNLGVVELTMALHLCLNLPKDKLIWDVGHQAYTHKILTGRKDAFGGLRSFGGLSGFPKHKESACDAFDTGHSSTSISAALGYVQGRDILNQHYKVVAVIGDGSLTGGMAYEALNNASRLRSNMVIILNDNKMSISENVGGMSGYLSDIRTTESYLDFKLGLENTLLKIPKVGSVVLEGLKKGKDAVKQLLIPGEFFEDLGIEYIGPIDGHDIEQLVQVINAAKRVDGPVLVHVITQKGRGYEPAELDPPAYHGVDRFDVATGEPLKQGGAPSYTKIFSMIMQKMAKEHENVVGVCAAMPYGTGLYKFSKRFPKRFFDVGIAEEHAVTFSAGLAAAGLRPYVAIYSSFFQRAYDQMIHDVCLQNLPVVFCIDRAGLVGADGETHQGIFDLSYLSSMPNMTIFAPKNKYELYDIMQYSLTIDTPLAIRYPRGTAYAGYKHLRAPIVHGKSEVLFEGRDLALLAVGSMVATALEAYEQLKAKGIEVTVVNTRFVKPMDTEMLDRLVSSHHTIITMEENVFSGGYGQQVMSYIQSKGQPVKVIPIAIPDVYVEHGNVDLLKETLGMDTAAVVKQVEECINS